MTEHYRDLVSRLRNRAYRLATRDFNGDGANLAIAAANAIDAMLSEREALAEHIEEEAKGMMEGVIQSDDPLITVSSYYHALARRVRESFT